MRALGASTRHASLWVETVEQRDRPPLENDLTVDVAVLGAGITGVTAALLLREAGLEVALLEGNRVGHGITGHTTAKVTSLHGLHYTQLLKQTGEETARAYGMANEEGLELVGDLVDRLGIECDFRPRDNYTYTEEEGNRRKIEQEVDAARQLGLPAELVGALDLPFPVAAAVKFRDQAEFHPLKYLLALIERYEESGGRVFEGTRATGVDDGEPCRVSTNRGATVEAERVIVATHFPFLDRGLFFARQHPSRSYVVACRIATEVPEGMYLSDEEQAHSIRSHPHAGGELLIVGGEAHKVGEADEADAYERLASWARERFEVEEIAYRWSAQDNMPIDGLPMIGRLAPFSDRILAATGFRKWGLAIGTSAAALLSETVSGSAGPRSWAAALDTRRLRPRAALPSLLKENANVARHFIGDRITNAGAPRCSHLGCLLVWNSGEESWDCPCHGSRFGPDGRVLQGPAVSPIEPPPPKS